MTTKELTKTVKRQQAEIDNLREQIVALRETVAKNKREAQRPVYYGGGRIA